MMYVELADCLCSLLLFFYLSLLFRFAVVSESSAPVFSFIHVYLLFLCCCFPLAAPVLFFPMHAFLLFLVAARKFTQI